MNVHVTAQPRRAGFWVALMPLALAASLLAAPVASAANPSGSRVATTYHNPMEPAIPGDGVVESCADPIVLEGQQPGDDYWYMYCTTDPLNDEDLDADGNLVFHKIPMMRSLDLVTWTYVGDAFNSLPSWAEPSAALWAPDVVYSHALDRYYLFFVVTNTDASVSGVENCPHDNAIGVATSDSPTGPWDFSDEPVVGPRQNGSGCNFFWTFDPDVLGDSVATSSVLYYGSYYGGVFATPVTLTRDAAVASDDAATQVAIGDRYEGSNVVVRDGYYYLFGSATNCCNGALTGYSVFVGRSSSPYGPFVDREGNSFNDTQAGGTPVLSMNGNRWVGTGHNSVFVDEGGQWWTMYHAVDRFDPFFETAPGFTKRPALLDPLDWIDGWPTVRGGLWASDQRMPAPAAQPGQRSAYRTKVARPHEARALIRTSSDGFNGSGLDGDWSWVRQPDSSTYGVSGGALWWQTQAADLYVDSNNASVLLRDAPKGAASYLVETKVRLDVPDSGCCFNYVQAGLVVYGDDNNFIKLTNTSIWGTRQTEFAKEIFPVAQGWSRYGNTVVGPPSEEWTYLRIAVDRLNPRRQRAAGGDTHHYTAYTSQDGVTWVRGGTWTHALGRDARIGVVSMGGDGYTAEFDYVRVHRSSGG